MELSLRPTLMLSNIGQSSNCRIQRKMTQGEERQIAILAVLVDVGTRRVDLFSVFSLCFLDAVHVCKCIKKEYAWRFTQQASELLTYLCRKYILQQSSVEQNMSFKASETSGLQGCQRRKIQRIKSISSLIAFHRLTNSKWQKQIQAVEPACRN